MKSPQFTRTFLTSPSLAALKQALLYGFLRVVSGLMLTPPVLCTSCTA